MTIQERVEWMFAAHPVFIDVKETRDAVAKQIDEAVAEASKTLCVPVFETKSKRVERVETEREQEARMIRGFRGAAAYRASKSKHAAICTEFVNELFGVAEFPCSPDTSADFEIEAKFDALLNRRLVIKRDATVYAFYTEMKLGTPKLDVLFGLIEALCDAKNHAQGELVKMVAQATNQIHVFEYEEGNLASKAAMFKVAEEFKAEGGRCVLQPRPRNQPIKRVESVGLAEGPISPQKFVSAPGTMDKIFWDNERLTANGLVGDMHVPKGKEVKGPYVSVPFDPAAQAELDRGSDLIKAHVEKEIRYRADWDPREVDIHVDPAQPGGDCTARTVVPAGKYRYAGDDQNPPPKNPVPMPPLDPTIVAALPILQAVFNRGAWECDKGCQPLTDADVKSVYKDNGAAFLCMKCGSRAGLFFPAAPAKIEDSAVSRRLRADFIAATKKIMEETGMVVSPKVPAIDGVPVTACTIRHQFEAGACVKCGAAE